MKRPVEQHPWRQFSPLNLAYLAEIYEVYQRSPQQVPAAFRELFERFGAPPVAVPTVSDRVEYSYRQIAGAVSLARAIRSYGHRAAQLDPLGTPPPGDPALLPETHGITEDDLRTLPAEVIGGVLSAGARDAWTVIQRLREVYQGTLGYEFEHLERAEERRWWEEAVESRQYAPSHDPIDELGLLRRLTEVGALERFLHRAFPGHIRFSLEGLGMMIPMLDELIGAAAEAGTRYILLGMAHRGRLNVLAHILGKPYEQIIAEFLGVYQSPGVSYSGSSDEGWTGDVKYHLGARRAYRGGEQVSVEVYLAPNPSHLEWVNPVVEGMARACGERRDRPGAPEQDERISLAVLIHGDAAFPAQGIVAETLNLYRLPGYRTGGTIHLIANNQIGFTTLPQHGRSTEYASDLAKGFDLPVIHVNADDPEACLTAVRLAHAYREQFLKDVIIDLVGYRRWGHNENDEPTFTQPEMYARIAQHPTVRELWVRRLVEKGLVTQAEADRMLQESIERLHALRRKVAEEVDVHLRQPLAGLEAGGERGGLGSLEVEESIDTTVDPALLQQLNAEITRIPEGFHLHPKLQRPFARRREAFAAEGKIDWAHAEALAFASLLAEGVPIRLTGQDVTRGTFSQRHLVLHDVQTGEQYNLLQNLPSARASFEVWDSPLSEAAVLGFEYGYSVQAPDVLVLWEAQYGDFANSAQVIIDQFIVSGRSKWGQRSGLVLLLPHGYEGQGPEHSSARLERFLQLAAENNIIVANCSTPAQYFHILRRQAKLLRLDPRPLVLLTPKSLLRHPMAVSSPQELALGRFHHLLYERRPAREMKRVRRLVLCSGKVYYDLLATGRLSPDSPHYSPEVAVARLEQFYPFPAEEVAAMIASYPHLQEVLWLQEEPRNMGAWTFVAPRLRDILGADIPLHYIGRTRMASPSEGTQEWHQQAQAQLVAAAFERVKAANEVEALHKS
ncbi:MAG: 2-oxoglutarate dehydrogenase E1 component [Armatimonadetes bacterium]|nr:2-oxoglutarate dehydrogenase E1 component [Armatimonadota bacterium]